MEKLTRSRFLSLGATMGAATALAACGVNPGSDSGSSGGSESPESSGSSGEVSEASTGSAPSGDSIAAEADVPVGESLAFEEDGQPAVLVHLDSGDFVAYSAACTHQGCEVAYRDAELVCPCHGSVFDPANGGEATTGPATSPLPEIAVQVQNGEVVRA